MDAMIDCMESKEYISVCVQDPKIHKEDFWTSHVDYEICLHTNSMYFRRKSSCVRRRYSEFVWLRQRLQDNAMLIDLPKLPPWNPFFSLRNNCQVAERIKGLQNFLEDVLQTPLLLSDSRLHLFLQSELSMVKMEACAQGQTRYTVAQAILASSCPVPQLPLEEDSQDDSKTGCDSDCESTTSSGLGQSVEPLLSSNEASPSTEHGYSQPLVHR